MTSIHTIGHSNHAIEAFVALLRLHGVNAIADVRSTPSSKRFPQFEKKVLQSNLDASGIQYVFLGDGLGARPRNPDCYIQGTAVFERIRATNSFTNALDRLQRGAQTYKICLMCAERDPVDCHRTWLVAQTLHDKGIVVKHILADGTIEMHDALLRRVAKSDFDTASLFDDEREILLAVANREAKRIAYCLDSSSSEEDRE